MLMSASFQFCYPWKIKNKLMSHVLSSFSQHAKLLYEESVLLVLVSLLGLFLYISHLKRFKKQFLHQSASQNKTLSRFYINMM